MPVSDPETDKVSDREARRSIRANPRPTPTAERRDVNVRVRAVAASTRQGD